MRARVRARRLDAGADELVQGGAVGVADLKPNGWSAHVLLLHSLDWEQYTYYELSC